MEPHLAKSASRQPMTCELAICVYCYKHILGVFFMAAKLTNTFSKVDKLKTGTISILFRVREISTRRGKSDNHETVS